MLHASENSFANAPAPLLKQSTIEIVQPGPTSTIQTESIQSLGQDSKQPWMYHIMEAFFNFLNLILIPTWCCSFVSVDEYDRIIVFRMGKALGLYGPGLVQINPFLDAYQKVDLRVQTIDVPKQKMMTSDTVTVEVNCIVYIKVVDPEKALLEVENYSYASRMFAATSLRSVVGMCDLDTLCVKREGINSKLRNVIQSETIKWGVVVSAVEVKDVVLPQNMQRAMASEAENERERRAKVVNASGEKEAASELAKAAQIISQTPGAMQLRYLHTLKNISVEKNSTIVFPLPMDLLNGFISREQMMSVQAQEQV